MELILRNATTLKTRPRLAGAKAARLSRKAEAGTASHIIIDIKIYSNYDEKVPYLKSQAFVEPGIIVKLFASRYLRYRTLALDRPKYFVSVRAFVQDSRCLTQSRQRLRRYVRAYIPTSDFSAAKTSDLSHLHAHFGNSDAKPIRI